MSSPELHIARVRAQVSRGGHDIPEARVRDRYDQSRLNLIELMPRLTELRVFDNSIEADPHSGIAPRPVLILHMIDGRLIETVDLPTTPPWARPLVVAATTRCDSRSPQHEAR